MPQGRTGDIGEIVVFVVIAHVQGEPVQRAIVRVRLLPGLVNEVFGDEMPRHGVHPHA